MKQSGARVGRPAVRTILALAVVGCAVPAYRYAQVATLRSNAPLEAVKIAPHDAKALAYALGGRFDKNPELKLGVQDLANIRAAIVDQPLESKLLSIMGLAYEASGDPAEAAKAMRVANRVSRRDSVSGLYLIENASVSGDVKAALRYYNVVLLTQPELNAVLLPILSSAIAYPEIREELRLYLKKGGKWVPGFLALAAQKGRVSDLQALLLPVPKALLAEEYAPILATVLHRIALEQDRATALRFAAMTISGLPPKLLGNLSVDAITLDKRLGLFAWNFPANDGIQVEVGDGSSLKISADPLARGTVAVRDLLLEAGNYRLVQRLKYGTGDGRIDARWRADCITPAGPVRFWDQRLPTLGVQGVYRSEFAVPEDCKVVRMSLAAEGPDGQMPATLALQGLLLSRAN